MSRQAKATHTCCKESCWFRYIESLLHVVTCFHAFDNVAGNGLTGEWSWCAQTPCRRHPWTRGWWCIFYCFIWWLWRWCCKSECVILLFYIISWMWHHGLQTFTDKMVLICFATMQIVLFSNNPFPFFGTGPQYLFKLSLIYPPAQLLHSSSYTKFLRVLLSKTKTWPFFQNKDFPATLSWLWVCIMWVCIDVVFWSLL